MKTNTSNLKQQLFTILLVAATVLSVSWISVKRNEQTDPQSKLKEIKNSKAQLMQKALSPILLSGKSIFTIKADTTKKKYKIVITDEKGKAKEYNSIDEMPADVRSEFMKQAYGFNLPDVDTSYMASFRKMFNSPDWKAQMEAIKKQFDSPEWRQQMADIGVMQRKMFESPEWKANQEQINKQFNSAEWKQKMEDIGKMQQKMFQSDEWKNNMKEMQEKFQSKEWQQKMKDMGEMQKKMFDSPEWKEKWENQQKMYDKMEKDMKNMDKEKREEKGIKEDEKLNKGPSTGELRIRDQKMYGVSYAADTTLNKKKSRSGNDPLFIVNGSIMENPLSVLNPEDISSMEVLKDAVATARYGDKGANGVVLITLKDNIKDQDLIDRAKKQKEGEKTHIQIQKL